MPKAKYYVTMTDKFLSGWGHAAGKINKLIFECETYQEAEIIEANARARSEMAYVNITRTDPHYSPSRYYAQKKTKEDSPAWYEAGRFSK